jgi:hypothetical protein
MPTEANGRYTQSAADQAQLSGVANHVRLLRPLIASRGSARARRGFESTDESVAAEPPAADDVLARVDETMKRMPPDEVVDPQEFRRALETLYRAAAPAIGRLKTDPEGPFTHQEAMALEAVIKTDGSRPSLLLRDGLPPENHPLAGAWTQQLADQRAIIRSIATATGRIEPERASGQNFFGTGWLVDAGKGIVLTNLHVLQAFMRRPTTLAKAENGKIRVFDGVYMDFVAETRTETRNRYRVVQAEPAGIDGDGFERLDVAALRIEPTDESKPLGQAVEVVADIDPPRGNVTSVCVIGYPGPPPRTSGVVEGVDWGWVNATLFGGRYGLKRIAPGTVHRQLGFSDSDPKGWIFGHDATTLGGCSGSALVAWVDGGGAFGIHFAGTTVDTNFAHAFAKCVEALKRLGVPVVE